MSPRLLRSVAQLLAFMVLGFGLAVAAGWMEGMVPVIATGGQSVPTAFNTACALSLSALALLVRLLGWVRTGRALSLAVVALALATLFQRAGWWGVDVDSLFLRHVAPHDAPWLNKMAANTAWALLACGLVGGLPDGREVLGERLRMALSAGVALVGGLAVVGWWLDWPAAISLGGALRMSLLTGGALMALGLAWALASLPRVRQDRFVLEPGVVLIALGGTLFSILAWHSLAYNQAQQLSAQALVAAYRAERLVNQALGHRATATHRLAERTLAWQRRAQGEAPGPAGLSAIDAGSHFRDFQALRALAIVGPEGVSLTARPAAAPLPAELGPVLQRLWPLENPATAGADALLEMPGLLIFRTWPEGPESPWVLAAVFELGAVLDDVNAGLPGEQGYELRMAGRVVGGRAQEQRSGYVAHRRFELLGQSFEMSTWPTREQAARELEKASPALLLVGLMMSFLAAMSLRLSYEARRRSFDAAMVSRRLAEETRERLRAQQALRQEQAQRMEAALEAARSLFEHVPAGALAVGTDGVVVECNANVPAILGGDAGDWPGRSVLALWADPAQAPSDFDAWARATAGWPFVSLPARRTDGSPLELNLSVAPIEVAGRIEGHYILVTDVTEVSRKNRQIALQAQLIEGTHDAIVAVDVHGAVVQWNKGAGRLYGLSAEQMAGQEFAMLFPADQRRVLREAIARVAHHRQARPGELELSLQPPSGPRQHIHLSLSGLEVDDAAAVLIYGVDVTQRKLAEYSLRRALIRAETQSARLSTLGRSAVDISRRLGSEDLLEYVVDQARMLVTSHMAALSLNAGASHAQDIQAVSLSDKLARWRQYQVPPDGSGIYAVVTETGQPLMLTQAQLEAHPRFRGFGPEAGAHPPLRGWLAVPLFGRDGKVIGVLQASDKVDGEYDDDLAILTQFAQMAAAAIEGEALYRRVHDAEQALQRELDVVEAMARSVGEGLLTVDRDGRVTFSNPACRRLLGWGEGDDAGAALDRLDLGGLSLQERVRQVADTRTSAQGGDGRVRCPDGSERMLAYTVSPLQDARGAQGCVAALRDITDLQRAHRHLRERDAFFNLSRDMFLTADARGVPRQVNPALAHVLGYTAEELMAGPFNRLVHPDDREMTQRAFHANAGPEAVKTLAHRVRTADGEYRWFEWTGSTAPDGLFYAVARDVTERMRAEREAQRLLADLGRSNAELQEFAFVASHDLQEPLRKILAFADRLQVKHASEMAPEVRDYVERMAGAAARMRGLIQDLLAYSRVGTHERRPEPVCVDALAAELVEQDLETVLQSTGARIEVQAAHAVMADRGQLHHVLLNLLSNALKFTDAQRPCVVRVVTRQEAAGDGEEPCVVIDVADNGIGFDPEHATRIFQPFQRLHGRGRYEGTGIGLAIVKKIVERHGGGIDVQSQPGVGTTFSIRLPAAHNQDPTP